MAERRSSPVSPTRGKGRRASPLPLVTGDDDDDDDDDERVMPMPGKLVFRPKKETGKGEQLRAKMPASPVATVGVRKSPRLNRSQSSSARQDERTFFD